MTNPDPHAALREHLAELRSGPDRRDLSGGVGRSGTQELLPAGRAGDPGGRRSHRPPRAGSATPHRRGPSPQTQDPGRVRLRLPQTHPQTKESCACLTVSSWPNISRPCSSDRRESGKTHLLTALGYTACERGVSVRFTRVVDMLNGLTTAQINGTLAKALKVYTTPSLLLLDELGYLPIDKRGADLMFQVVAARYETGSTVITTNRAFRDWGKIFDVDNTLATAMIDRLMHHGEASRHSRRQLSPERQTTRISSGPSCSAHKSTGRTSRPDSTSDWAAAPLSCAESVAGDWAAVAGPSLAPCYPVSNLW